MNESLVYLTTHPLENQKSEECTQRWSEEDTRKIRTAIVENNELPRIFPPLEVTFCGKKLILEDLRGINLQGLEIKDYDLAYCALDFSSLDESTLTGTSLQYSRLVKASLKNTKLSKIQASPIDGRQVNLAGALLTECFISNSDLRNANFGGITIEGCDFSQSEMPTVVRAVKRGRAGARSTIIKKLQKYYHKIIDFRDDFNLAEVGGEGTRFGQLHVGTVVSVAKIKSSTHVKVEVISKPRITSDGKEILKPMFFSVNAGRNPLSIGQLVEIINKRAESAQDKNVKGRNKKISRLQVQKAMKDKNKWILSKVDFVQYPLKADAGETSRKYLVERPYHTPKPTKKKKAKDVLATMK